MYVRFVWKLRSSVLLETITKSVDEFLCTRDNTYLFKFEESLEFDGMLEYPILIRKRCNENKIRL